MRKIVFLGAVMMLVAFLPLAARAEVIMNETFTDGDRALDTDPQDAAWFTTSGGTLSVGTNAVIGSGNAMTFTHTAVNPTNKWQQRIVGQMRETATLVNTGDWAKLSFDVVLNNSTAGAIRTFRFGLFNSNGTPFLADATDITASGLAANDTGYMAALSTGTAVRGDLLYEQDTDLTFMGGTPSPLTVFTDALLPGLSANNTTRYSLSLIVTKGAAGMTVEYLQDGVSKLINTTPFTTQLLNFDEVGFAGGIATSPYSQLDWTLDNVTVEVVPEPATLALLGLGGMVFLRKRKA